MPWIRSKTTHEEDDVMGTVMSEQRALIKHYFKPQLFDYFHVDVTTALDILNELITELKKTAITRPESGPI
jgi:hypothetical protein